MRIGIDTNILVYAEGINGHDRRAAAFNVLERLPVGSAVLPVQTLGELFHVLVRKARLPPDQARSRVHGWAIGYPTADTTASALSAAVDLAATHQLSIWDSLIIAVSAENRCQLLLSEDLQDGFSWNGLTVVNPFAESPSALLQAILRGHIR